MQNKQFTYQLRSDDSVRTLTFTLPYENGSVVTNLYCPQELLTGGLSFVTAINGESLSEFDRDCRNQIKGIEAAEDRYDKDDSKMDSHIAGLMTAVMNHINRCGRLIFGDLLIYVDVFSYLLAADGYSEEEVKAVYPRILRTIIELYPQYVKNTGDLSPFKGSFTDFLLASLIK